uniref:Uncharacterized protein n=1 Tax=Arundo donax TaxID=35708 RepID=A0A0A9C5T4_ARUDO
MRHARISLTCDCTLGSKHCRAYVRSSPPCCFAAFVLGLICLICNDDMATRIHGHTCTCMQYV